MDSVKFSGLSFWKRLTSLGVVGIIIVLGLLSISVSLYQTAENANMEYEKEQAIMEYNKSVEMHLENLERKLRDINERIENTTNGELKEYLSNQKREIELLIQDEKKRENLKQKYIESSSIINFSIFNSAHAQTQNSVSELKKHHVLWSILGLLALVYLGALYSLFLSRIPRNIDLATDLVKTLTGFFIGIATTVLA